MGMSDHPPPIEEQVLYLANRLARLERALRRIVHHPAASMSAITAEMAAIAEEALLPHDDDEPKPLR
jgi:hypothetical protein